MRPPQSGLVQVGFWEVVTAGGGRLTDSQPIASNRVAEIAVVAILDSLFAAPMPAMAEMEYSAASGPESWIFQCSRASGKLTIATV
jgi:hypothetical protein